MKRPNTVGWEKAARRYCKMAGEDPDGVVRNPEQPFNNVFHWTLVADMLFEHQRRNHALGIFTEMAEVITSDKLIFDEEEPIQSTGDGCICNPACGVNPTCRVHGDGL